MSINHSMGLEIMGAQEDAVMKALVCGKEAQTDFLNLGPKIAGRAPGSGILNSTHIESYRTKCA